MDNFLIRKDLLSYIGSNVYEKVLHLLKSGKDVALVSARGMPCISDPGAEIIQYFRKIKIDLIFMFFPTKKGDIIKIINDLTYQNYIFFDSTYRIKKTLTLFKEYLQERIIYIARELTKTYEEVLIATSEGLLNKGIK